MSRYIDADALIAELQKDEERFDKEAEDCRKNSRNYTDCYMQAMSSRADGIRDAMIEIYDAPSIDIVRRKPVVGYEGYYEVDMYGNVYSVARTVQVNDNGRIYDKPVKEKKLTASKHSCGYRTVALTRNGKTEQQYIHRIVAEAYIQNPQNLPWINHKDEDKANNFVGNLEWCTPLYNNTYNEKNIKHSEKIKGRSFTDEHKERIRQSNLGKHGQQRKVICVDDGTVFGSYNEAGKHYGISPMTVKSCCERKSKGKVRTFRYADDFCSYGEREGER